MLNIKLIHKDNSIIYNTNMLSVSTEKINANICSVCYEDFIHIEYISKEDFWNIYQKIIPNRYSVSYSNFTLAQRRLYGLIIDTRQTPYSCTTPLCGTKMCGTCFDKLTSNKPKYATHSCPFCKIMTWISHMKKPITNGLLRIHHTDNLFEHIWNLYQDSV